MVKAVQYLEKYGYVPPSQTGSLVMPGGGLTRQLKDALKKLQSFGGIEQTGELDKATMELMEKPRCGVKDILSHDAQSGRLCFAFLITNKPNPFTIL